jgi:hypothetical protein
MSDCQQCAQVRPANHGGSCQLSCTRFCLRSCSCTSGPHPSSSSISIASMQHSRSRRLRSVLHQRSVRRKHCASLPAHLQ